MLVGGKPTAGKRLRRSEATGCERRRPKGGGFSEASPKRVWRWGTGAKKRIFFGSGEEKINLLANLFLTEGVGWSQGRNRMTSNASRVPDHPPYFLVALFAVSQGKLTTNGKKRQDMRITKTSALAWLQTI